MDQLTIESVMRSLIINVAFLATTWGLLALVIAMLVKEPAERKTGVKVAGVTVIIMAFAWFWAVASLGFPALDQVVDNMLAKSGHVVTTAVVAVPDIHVQVDVPEQAPPRDEISTDNSGEPVVSEIPDEPQDVNTSVINRDGELFDLGSEIDGYFGDGIPYTEYTVQAGDNLYRIGQNFDVDDIEIASRNGLHIGRYVIRPGDILKIPQ